jgi:8-oxo-dGTP diphosphatase
MKKIQELNAYVVVFDNKGRILFLKRREPEVWEFPGGGVEFGEEPEKTAKRETYEETKLKIKDLKLICTTSKVFKKKGKIKHAVYVVYKAKASGEVKLGVEHSSALWAHLKEARKLKLGYNVVPILRFLNVRG